LYLADARQQTGNITEVFHEAESAASDQKFKGILDDAARAVFYGKIKVSPGAAGTSATQQHDAMVLTSKASVTAMPFLEIYADEVKCSHGNTTGQIDKEALFYIRQRGISEKDARLLQLYAFAGELIDMLPAELKEATKDLVKKRLNGDWDNCDNCILQCMNKHITG